MWSARVRTEHAPVGEEAQEAADLFAGGGRGLQLDESAVGADDAVRWQDEERGGDADEDDDEERLRGVSGARGTLGARRRTMYVEVETASSLPLRMLIARAMTEPMNAPNWKMAQKMEKALPLSFSSG